MFNIIAAAGDGPHHGLPGVTRPRSAQPEARIGSHLLVSTLSDVKECVDESKWNSRGWTYQEALLSRRKVVFTPTQVYFQCAAMHCQESLQVPLRQLHTNNLQEFRFNIQLPKAFPARGLGRLPWDIFDRISEYSRRDLSYNGDALRAFQGILNGFERMKTSVANFYGVAVLSHHRDSVQARHGHRAAALRAVLVRRRAVQATTGVPELDVGGVELSTGVAALPAVRV